MDAHVLLFYKKKVGRKAIKCEACRAFYRYFATSLKNSITQEYEESIYHMTLKLLCNRIFGVNNVRILPYARR